MALTLRLLDLRWLERSNNRFVKDILELELRQGRALHVLDGTQLLCHLLAVFFPYGRHLLLCKLLADILIISQICLSTNYQAWHAWTVVVDFRKPLFPYVLKRCRRSDGEADKEDVGLRIGEGS